MRIGKWLEVYKTVSNVHGVRRVVGPLLECNYILFYMALKICPLLAMTTCSNSYKNLYILGAVCE